jgi:hypothetical protein
VKKESIKVKAKHTAARFYYGINLKAYVEDWANDDGETINLKEEIDKDVRDLADLLVSFHKECQKEKL